MTAIQYAAEILGGKARHNEPIAPLTTYRLGGPAALMVRIETEADAVLVAAATSQSGVATLVVGKGSNLLVADRGFDGLVITLGGVFSAIDQEPDTPLVSAGAAVALPVLARQSAAMSLTGLEWMVGVPGSVGGAVRMNAGGHGSQTVETLRAIRLIDLKAGGLIEKAAAELALTYRSSNVEPHHLILDAEFELEPGDKEKSENEISEIVKWRRENQPGGRNCGSVFTNPPGQSSGQLIEAAGMRGHELGSASVSPKHANFIQSEDGGTAADVLALIKEVRSKVSESSGVALQPEVRLVGFTEEELADL